MGTLTISRRHEESVKCPECNGLLSVGKHRAKPRCERCRGRGWIMADNSEYGATATNQNKLGWDHLTLIGKKQ